MISLEEAWSIPDTKENIVGLCPTLINFMGEKPIMQLAFLADLSDTFYNCGVGKGEVVES